jgi:hypothetical protein
MKRAHTHHARNFTQGQDVLVHNVRGQSVPATVVQRLSARTYLVEFHNGTRSLRHQKFLTSIPRKETQAPTTTSNVTLLDPGALPAIRGATGTTPPPAVLATMDQVPARSLDPAPPLQASTVTAQVLVPRQNPCSPARLSTQVTRSGRRIVPTLKALGQ